MLEMSGFTKRRDRSVTQRLFLLAAWTVGAVAVPMASARLALLTNQQSPRPQRAAIPLSEIAGVDAPPAPTVVPLAEVPDVQAACERAHAQIEDGSHQAAVETLTGALEAPGGDRYEIHYLLALAGKRSGRLDAARASAEAAARLGHGNADVHYLLAQICHQQGKVESAIPHYRSATLAAERELNNPNVTLAWYHLGQALAEAGYDRAAAEAYEHFDVAIWQTHPEQRNAPEIATLLAQRPHGMVPRRLQLLGGLGRTAPAVHVAEWARAVWPDDIVVARMYAQTLLSAGEAARAFAFCRQRLDEPGSTGALLPIAIDAGRAAHRLDEWIETVVGEVREGRGCERAAALARHLRRNGAPNKAVRVGQALLTQQPNADDLVWEVAAAQRATGDLRGALETLITYVRNKPDLSEMPRQQLAAWMGWLESGVDVVGLVQELRSRPAADFATDFVLGVSALAADQLALADELLQSCVATRPDFAAAYVVQGEMSLATYQWDAAKAHADKLLKDRPELAAAHYVLAEAHAGLDENEQAEGAYKQAIKLRPVEHAYRLALAEYYRRLGNLLGAQRHFQAVLENESGNGQALEGLIDCYLRGGKVELARAQLERVDRTALPQDTLRRVDTLMRFLSAPFGEEHLAELHAQLEQHPDDLATARLLAGGLYLRARLDEAYEVIQKTRATQPNNYHFMVLLANVHAVRGEFDEAISLLAVLARRFPNRLIVLEPLALCYLNDFRLEEGRAVLRRLIELDPDSRGRHRAALLHSYVEFRECDMALEMVDGWIEAEPDDEDLVSAKIGVLLKCDRKNEAYSLAERRLEEKPNDGSRRKEFVDYDYGEKAEQYLQVAEHVRQWWEDQPDSAALTGTLIALLIDGDCPEEALEVAREFRGTYEESIQRRVWLGVCQAERGQTDTALAEFDALLDERGVERRVGPAVRRQIVRTLINAERYDEALVRCQAWLQRAETDHDAALRLEALAYKAGMLQAAGRDREYAEVAETLLEYVPNSIGLLNDLGYTWVDMGKNVERATEMIRRAVAADPWNAAFIDSLGWAYYKAGDFSNAHKYLARAVRLRDGQDAVVYDHLADAACRLGDHDAAARHWKTALSLVAAKTPERERTRLADVAAAVRAKLAAAARFEPPRLAPTAAEQNE